MDISEEIGLVKQWLPYLIHRVANHRRIAAFYHHKDIVCRIESANEVDQSC